MRLLTFTLCLGSAALLAIGGCGNTCPGSTGSGTCFELNNESTGQTCDYKSGNANNCATGQTAGHCPAEGLIGCCVTTSSVLGCSETGADCFYAEADGGTAAATAAANAQAACTGGVAGTNLAWTTTAP